MGSFIWILVLQTLALAKCSLSENSNTELADLKNLFNNLVDKQNEMEKEMKQMHIKNEIMEARISQLQFAYRQQKWYLYKNNEQLHRVQQQNDNLRIIISDLQTKERKPETNVNFKSATVSRTPHWCCEKDTKPFQKRIMKHFLEHTQHQTQNNIANHTFSPANASADISLHKNMMNSYLEKQNVEDKTVAKDKPKRLLIPATSIPDTSKTVVAFQARPSQHISNVGDNQHLEFDHVVFSEGPEYDKTTGTFQCAIPGVYMFFVTLLTEPNKFLEAAIVHNGNNLAYIYGYNDNHYGSGTNMAVVRLQTGDRVWVRVNSGQHHSGTIIDYGFTTFSGFLLQS